MHKQVCRKCGPLPRSEFYRSDQRRCKSCVRKAVSAYRWRNIEKVRAWDRKRGKRPDRRARMRGKYAIYKARFPGKVRAQDKVQWAITKGTLKRRPCEVCGNPRTDAHHSDYRKPLKVRFLCRVHHAAIHHKARTSAA